VESEITNFGKHLREVRLKKKMPQGNNAKKLRVHRSSISGLEGWKRNPSLLTVNKIAKVIGVELRNFSKESYPGMLTVYDGSIKRVFTSRLRTQT